MNIINIWGHAIIYLSLSSAQGAHIHRRKSVRMGEISGSIYNAVSSEGLDRRQDTVPASAGAGRPGT